MKAAIISRSSPGTIASTSWVTVREHRLGLHSSAPDTNVDVYRNGAIFHSNVALKINWGGTTTQVCNGRLASGAASRDWEDGDVLVLYTP